MPLGGGGAPKGDSYASEGAWGMFRGGGPGGGREGPEEEDMMVPAALSLAFWALVSCPLGGGGGGPGGGAYSWQLLWEGGYFGDGGWKMIC